MAFVDDEVFPGLLGDVYLSDRNAGFGNQFGGEHVPDRAAGGEYRRHRGLEDMRDASGVDAARDLIGAGCTEIVLITLGAEGALLVTAETARYQPPVTVRTNGGVGAGDGMIAAMTVALNRDKPIEQAVKLGAAAGAAVLVNPGTAGCRRSEIVDLLTRAPDAVDAVERADVYSFIQNQITAARHRQHGRGRRVQAAPRSDQTA